MLCAEMTWAVHEAHHEVLYHVLHGEIVDTQVRADGCALMLFNGESLGTSRTIGVARLTELMHRNTGRENSESAEASFAGNGGCCTGIRGMSGWDARGAHVNDEARAHGHREPRGAPCDPQQS